MRSTVPPIILASTSPRRQELMKLLGIKFKIVAPEYEEDMTIPMPPKKLVVHLALGKAQSIFEKNKKCVVIGSDTIVVARGKVLGKPKSVREAKRMLALASNSKVFIHTGMAIIVPGKKTIQIVSSASVYFRKMSGKEIAEYVKTGDARGYAGGFAEQGKGAVFIKKSHGNIQSILGLPVYDLARVLERLGYRLWSEK